jgi:hypothetical protein
MSMTTTFTVSSEGATSNNTDTTTLNGAIRSIDVGGSNAATNTAYVINIAGQIDLTSDLLAINLPSGSSLTIEGTTSDGGSPAVETIDGRNTERGLFVYAGNVTVENLIIADAVAQGGNGTGGGGGGAGLGGGLFVASAGSVILDNVTFSNDAARGGNGATGVFGGGGGLGGNAGSHGGGGIGLAAGGGAINGFGGDGIVAGAAAGGSSNLADVLGFPNGGAAGGGGGGGPGPGGGGGIGGGVGGSDGGGGGFGGGGGGGIHGGAGSFGGGGGGGSYGGGGGFGGGGGGGFSPDRAGAGEFGAGSGAQTAGGGGLGAGGDIFVQQGGSLTIEGGSLSGGQVAGGTGAGSAGGGAGFGRGIFIQGNQSITLAPPSGQTLAVGDIIVDQTGRGGTGSNAGAGTVILDGVGTVVFYQPNAYTGGTTLDSGTLELVAGAAAGTGAITFGGPAATLQIDGTTMPSNTINALAIGDVIDLRGLAFVAGATASYDSSTHILTVTSNGISEALTLTNPAIPTFGAPTSDGFGETKVGLKVDGTQLASLGGVTSDFHPVVGRTITFSIDDDDHDLPTSGIQYSWQTSADGTNWSTVFSETAGTSSSYTPTPAEQGASTRMRVVIVYGDDVTHAVALNFATGVLVDPGPGVTDTTTPGEKIAHGIASQIGTASPGLPGDTLSLTQLSGFADGTVTLSGGTIKFTPASASGTAAFSYQISDQFGDLSPVISDTLTIDPGPTAIDTTTPGETLFQGATIAIGTVTPGLAGDILSLTELTGPAGAVTLNNGIVSFTAPANASGNVTFSYEIKDQLGDVSAVISDTLAVAVDETQLASLGGVTSDFHPVVGRTITFSIDDLDHDVPTSGVQYSWQTSTDGTSWSTVFSETAGTSSSYTPTPAEAGAGTHMRAVVVYNDETTHAVAATFATGVLVGASWARGVNGDWNNAADWKPSVVPSTDNDVIVAATGTGNYTVTSSSDNAVHSLSIRATTATLAIQDGTTFLVSGPLIGDNGAITLGSTGDATRLQIDGSTALIGSGTLMLSDNAENIIEGGPAGGATLINKATIAGAGQIGQGDAHLTLRNGAVIDAFQSLALVIDTGNLVQNGGTLEATGGGGLTVKDAVYSRGAAADLLANAGNLTFEEAVTGNGRAGINAATLDFKVAARVQVSFLGTSGKLQLDDAGEFTGTVAGLATSTGNAIDFTGIAFAGVTGQFKQHGSQGTLTLGDGPDTANVTLLGQYVANFHDFPPPTPSGYNGFVLANDGSGGTLVSYEHN